MDLYPGAWTDNFGGIPDSSGFASLEFWLSFTTTLVLVGSPWIVYALWRGRDDDDDLFSSPDHDGLDDLDVHRSVAGSVRGTELDGSSGSAAAHASVTASRRTKSGYEVESTKNTSSTRKPSHGKSANNKKKKRGSHPSHGGQSNAGNASSGAGGTKVAAEDTGHWSDHSEDGSAADSEGGSDKARAPAPQGCKIVPNPMHLLRAAEYMRYSISEKREALTEYDKSLAARDQQAIFCNPIDCAGDKALEIAHAAMMTAWQGKDTEKRIQLSRHALSISKNCAGAYILLAEEEMTTIGEAYELLSRAAEAGERHLKRLDANYFTKHAADFWMKPETRPYVYARRRMGMCLSKMGKYDEAVKIFAELLENYPSVTCSHLNVQSNMIDALLNMNMFTEAQALLDKYESCMGRSALLYYTAALLKIKQCANSFAGGTANNKALSTDVLVATDALHQAIEYNPHVPQYILEFKNIVLPPEHTALRGDSEAVAYAFDHIKHWKSVPSALELLECTWESYRRSQNALKGQRFEDYTKNMEQTDRRLLPAHHTVSVFPELYIPLEAIAIISLAITGATVVLAFLVQAQLAMV